MASSIIAPTDPSLGIDVDTFLINVDGVPDLDPNFTLINGPKAVAQSVARYWLSDNGSLITNEAAGTNIRDLLSAEFDARPDAVSFVKALLASEARRDERVEDIAITLTLDAQMLTIQAIVTSANPADSPFSFVLTIDKVTKATILEVAE